MGKIGMSGTAKKSSKDYFFHPLEISFCGDSGVGKTTLIAKLIKNISKKCDVGYIKHDAHRFEMDHQGKDTYKARNAGARAVFISNDHQSALLEMNVSEGRNTSPHDENVSANEIANKNISPHNEGNASPHDENVSANEIANKNTSPRDEGNTSPSDDGDSSPRNDGDSSPRNDGDSSPSDENIFSNKVDGKPVGEKILIDEKLRWSMNDCDVVFIEGYKKSLVRKILFLSEKSEHDAVLDHYRNGSLKNVIAIISSKVSGSSGVLAGSGSSAGSGVSGGSEGLAGSEGSAGSAGSEVLGSSAGSASSADSGASASSGSSAGSESSADSGSSAGSAGSAASAASASSAVSGSSKVPGSSASLGSSAGSAGSADSEVSGSSGGSGSFKKIAGDIPFFHRDDLDGIEQFIFKTWDDLLSKRKLYGLVLSGGKSTRMKTDKGALTYFGKSQVEHVYQLLSKYCETSFVSCTKEQSGEKHLKSFPQIHDRFLDFGPTGGILSAMHRYDDAAWLVVACDLPYLQQSTLEKLVQERNPYKMATCFFNRQRNWPEPLCAIYEPKALLKLAYNLALKKPCPRKVLSTSNVHLLSPDFGKHLENVNTPQEKELAEKELAEKELSGKELAENKLGGS